MMKPGFKIPEGFNLNSTVPGAVFLKVFHTNENPEGFNSNRSTVV
jgi:hypothetical protein